MSAALPAAMPGPRRPAQSLWFLRRRTTYESHAAAPKYVRRGRIERRDRPPYPGQDGVGGVPDGSAIGSGLASAAQGAGDIAVDMAMISNGDLRVFGTLAPPRAAKIVLDDKFDTRADQDGRFAFRIPYHPETCVVTLKSDSLSRQAVVGYCARPAAVKQAAAVPSPPIHVMLAANTSKGEVGPRGPQGAAGQQGPEGPQGERGAKGEPGTAIALRVQVEDCTAGGRCVATCTTEEFAVNGTCSGGERPAMDESSIYCFAMGATPIAMKARAICARR